MKRATALLAVMAVGAVGAFAQAPPPGAVRPPPPAPRSPAIVAPPVGAAAPLPAPAVPGAASVPRSYREPMSLPVGQLQALEKITGRVHAVDAVVGEPTRIGALTITLRACRKRPQEDIPEAAAFFEIAETRPGETAAVRLYAGWMFASSPAVAALEHPVYDVWLVDCRAAAGSSSR